MVEIRKEIPADYREIRALNELAFGQPDEGSIVDNIRKACNDVLSLVAVKDNKIIGHIFFSPVSIKNQNESLKGMGLGPMAVLPEHQKQGVGSLLVNKGIEMLSKAGVHYIIVLGHADYYPRFGFKLASTYNLSPQWDGVPNDVFMILPLDELALSGVSGVVHYRKEFG